MGNKITYSKNDVAIVAALRNAPDGLTLSEIASATGLDIKSGHIVGAKKKGLVDVIGEREVIRAATKTVVTYNYVDSEAHKRPDGKVWDYTPNELELLEAASKMEGPFTLEALAHAMGKERLSSGSINSLVNKKGNITKGDPIKVPSTVKGSVNVYGLVGEIPTDAVIK